MANNNTQVRATSFSVTIEAPMHRPLVLFKGMDEHQWEANFVMLRDNEADPDYKRNYDRCRAVLKYAYSCWGALKDVSNGNEIVKFTFEFDNIEGLTTFEKDLQKVESAVIM